MGDASACVVMLGTFSELEWGSVYRNAQKNVYKSQNPFKKLGKDEIDKGIKKESISISLGYFTSQERSAVMKRISSSIFNLPYLQLAEPGRRIESHPAEKVSS